MYVVTGNEGGILSKRYPKVHFDLVRQQSRVNPIARIISNTYMQLRVCRKLRRVAGQVDLWVFFFGSSAMLAPHLVAKLSGGDVILTLAGSDTKDFQAHNRIASKGVALLARLNYALSSRIVVYSENIIEECDLEKYRDKVMVAHNHFPDFDMFRVEKPFSERESVVGYVGRLSEEKGIIPLVEAIPAILRARDDIRFLIVGDGRLRDRAAQYLSKQGIDGKVEFAGWMPHEDLPEVFNKLRLVVFPSYTEGLPMALVEAMACGTPVMATLVGAIPDLIRDRETGFILDGNSPEYIAREVVKALDSPEIGEIANSSWAFARKEYTREAAAGRYRDVLNSLKWS